MNEPQNSAAEAIRSDIDVIRRRLDDTIDALGDRLQPRHLLDEVLGYLRGNSAEGENRMSQIKERVTQSAESALHSVVDTVKQNPLPALLIGAGVGWMIYESMRDRTPPPADGDYYGYSREGERLAYDPDTHYDRPLEYPSSLEGAEAEWSGEADSKLGEMKDRLADQASEAKNNLQAKLAEVGEAEREKAGALKDRASEKFQAVKARTGEVAARAKDRTRAAYGRTRERIVTTADRHPLEVGLVALATGVLVGLALPTPAPVHRTAGRQTRRDTTEGPEKPLGQRGATSADTVRPSREEMRAPRKQ